MEISIKTGDVEIESIFSATADVTLHGFLPDPTDQLPMRTKNLKIERLNIEQLRDLHEVIGGYLKIADKERFTL